MNDTRPKLNGEEAVLDALKISRSTYRALIRSKELRVVRIGRSVRVSDDELRRFVAERES